MSFATLQRAIIQGARFVVRNPRLKLKDIVEWATDEKTVKDNCDPKHEVYFYVPDPGVWVCIHKLNDWRATPSRPSRPLREKKEAT